MKTTRQNALIFSFTFMAFILGTTEYIIVGLLSEISSSLGVTLATAGDWYLASRFLMPLVHQL